MIAFLLDEWRPISIIVLVIGLYAMIYHHGYEASEEKIEKARVEAASEEHARAAVALKAVQADNIKEHNKDLEIQGKLDALVKKYNSMPCAVTLDGVRELNSLDK